MMKFHLLYLMCILLYLSGESKGFDFIRDMLFPRFPTVTRVRDLEEVRFIGDEFAVLDTVGLVQQYGYPAEQHNVTTEDGYKIIFFRIPGSPNSPMNKGKPIVFMQHGMAASSDSWVLLGPQKDLAFLLADAGYDVWMGNVRGNSYGRDHTDLSPQDPEFWKFSFHEIGMWDVAKMVDHALEYTDQKTLYYIGHSMGTTEAYILLSERPEYNDKIRLFVALAPVAIWKGPPSPLIRLLVQHGVAIKAFLEKYGIHELVPQTTNNGKIARTFCSDYSLTQPACAAIYFTIAGDDGMQLNSSILSHIVSYVPAGISTKTIDHFRQNMLSGIFQPFDDGYVENFKLYGKKKPPIYDIKKITTPIAMIYGKNDALSIEENVAEIARRLRNLVAFEAVPYELFNHFDFLWAINAKELLFDRIIQILSEH